MKITDQQALLLFIIAKDSLRIADGGTIFSVDEDNRNALVHKILNQQDNNPIELNQEPEDV